jgi:G3E family GTPase
MNEGPDPAMKAALFTASSSTEQGMRDTVEPAVLCYSSVEHIPEVGEPIVPGAQLYELPLQKTPVRFTLSIPEDGACVLFTEHHPDEFTASLEDASGIRQEPLFTREYKPDHEHDDEVTSVGITTPGDLNLQKFQDWLRELLAVHGQDIFRMKGILSFRGMPERFVFQGVHMLFDGRPDRPWGQNPRRNSLIFIGRNLNREELNAGFEACLV